MSVQERESEGRASFSAVFTEALRGLPCTVLGPDGAPEELPVHQWSRDADDEDLELLGHCVGHTLDLGCGPGRLTAALTALGQVTLGIDVVREAVDQTVARGGAALRRDVFDRLPGEGRWQSALLADGNVGIGGDPVALLRRVRRLVEPGGRVVVELAGPGVPTSTRWAVLRCDGVFSAPFRWSTVGVDGASDVAHEAGFAEVEVHPVGRRRWCAVLRTPVGGDA